MLKPPLFVLLVDRKSGPLQIEGPDIKWIPFFTSRQKAETYVRRSKLECEILDLTTAGDIEAFSAKLKSERRFSTSCNIKVDHDSESGDEWEMIDLSSISDE